MKTYEIKDRGEGVKILRVTEREKKWSVPFDPANRHYQEYLRYQEWISQGNNPEDFWDQDAPLSNT